MNESGYIKKAMDIMLEADDGAIKKILSENGIDVDCKPDEIEKQMRLMGLFGAIEHCSDGRSFFILKKEIVRHRLAEAEITGKKNDDTKIVISEFEAVKIS